MFNGFTDATTDFLWQIRFNNEREWFLAHKQDYMTAVWKPFRALAGEVYDAYMKNNPREELNLHVSRIYRDARRLHGMGPYKDHLWFSLRPECDYWAEKPALWFEINPEGYCYGMGVYAPKPAMMARCRREMDEAPREMTELAEKFAAQKRFINAGEEYARKKGDALPPLDSWYNRKTVDLVCRRRVDKGFRSPGLVKNVTDGFKFLTPYYDYFSRMAAMAD